MFTEQERDYVRDILADPESSVPRLRYATYLESVNDIRAEAVRVGAELRERKRTLMGTLEKDVRLEELERRQKNLNVDYSAKYRAALPKLAGITWGPFEGGIIEQVTISRPRGFAKIAGQIFEVQPVIQFHSSSGLDDETLPQILGAPDMACLGGLYLGGHYEGPAVARVLGESRHIENLRCLNISFVQIGDTGAKHLAKAKHLVGLRDLSLHRNEINSAGFKALCASPHLENVERLLLGWNSLGKNAGEVLAKSCFKRLRWLDLSDTEHSSVALMALAKSGRLSEIEWLNLSHCKLDAAATEAILQVVDKRLERANLLGNTLGAGTCATLAACRFPKLRELNLELHGEVDKTTSKKLAKSAWLSRLEKLQLRGRSWLSVGRALCETRLDALVQLHAVCFEMKEAAPAPYDDTVALLAANPTLGNLRLLELHAPISASAFQHLAKLKSLTQLKIPFALLPDAKKLQAELPNCKITQTSFGF